MKHWHETREVLDFLALVLGEGQRAALATVVRVRGSAYRHEGAKLAVAEEGTTAGNVSGGCLEQDVREVALQVIRTGRAELRSYCSSADEIEAWDLGVGCEGQVDVLFEPVGETWPRERALLGGDESGIYELAGHGVFIDVFEPPPQLVILGAGDDARPLARFAADVGFRVVVVDRRPGYLTRDRFPAAALLVESDGDRLAEALPLDPACHAVVMTHNFADDQAYLRVLVGTPVAYIGMLGPRQRTERILKNVTAAAPVDEGRVYGPVGLDIGTDGAEQVALAVIAEILAVRSGRRARSLRERQAPIHAPAD